MKKITLILLMVILTAYSCTDRGDFAEKYKIYSADGGIYWTDEITEDTTIPQVEFICNGKKIKLTGTYTITEKIKK